MSGLIVKWYAAKWCNTPERMEFIRETEHMLFRRDFRRVRRERKVSTCGRYYDTYEEAQAAIDAFKADKAAARAQRRLTEVAPELLEALKYARRFLNSDDHDTAYVDAAIAKATGEQP